MEYMKGKESFRKVEESLESELKTLENETQAIKEGASDQVEMDWLREKLGLMREKGETKYVGPDYLEVAYKEIQEGKERVDKAFIDLANFKTQYVDKLEENVEAGGVYLRFISIRERLNEISETLKTVDSKIEDLDKQVEEKE